jgi:hypothetical protein
MHAAMYLITYMPSRPTPGQLETRQTFASCYFIDPANIQSIVFHIILWNRHAVLVIYMPREKLQQLSLLCVTNGSPYLADTYESDRYIPFICFNGNIDVLLKNAREYYYTKICPNINGRFHPVIGHEGP